MKHPLQQFRFCPRCGSNGFIDHNDKAKKCTDCDFTYYFNSSAAVVAVIENSEGELLVARRAKDPAKGTLDLPGGFVDMQETAEEAVQREIEEETGLLIKSPQYLFSLPNIYLYSGFEVHTVDIFFKCKIDDFSGIDAQDDVAELFFIAPDRLDPADFGLNSIQEAIKIIISKNENN